MDCNRCEYKATSALDLDRHKLQHDDTDKILFCDIGECRYKTTSAYNLARHKKSLKKHSDKKEKLVLLCDIDDCGYKTTSTYNLARHKREYHARKDKPCPNQNCQKKFKTDIQVRKHIEKSHPCHICQGVCLEPHNHNRPRAPKRKADVGRDKPAKMPRQAKIRGHNFSNILYDVTYHPNSKDGIPVILSRYKPLIFLELKKKLTVFGRAKYHLNSRVTFYKDDEGVTRTIQPWFNCGAQTLLGEHDLERTFQRILRNLETMVEEFSENGSNWKFQEISEMYLTVVKYRPQRPSSFIELPEEIKNKNAVINVKNDDQLCFLYAVLTYLLRGQGKDVWHLEQVNTYTSDISKLNVENLSFPMSIDDIPKFQKMNPSLPPINVYALEKNLIVPVFISTKTLEKKELFDYDKSFINLLILEDDQNNSHYCYISNFKRLCSSRQSQRHVCPFCLQGFRSDADGEKRLQEHVQYCQKENPTRVKCPTDSTLHFTQTKYMIQNPFVIYSDFETLQVPSKDDSIGGKKTTLEKVHQACGYGILVVNHYSEEVEEKVYRGPNVEENYQKDMDEVRNKCLKWIKENGHVKMIPLTDEQQKEYDNAKTCWICQKGDFTPESDFLPTKWKKTKTPSKDDVHHLDNLAPYLEDCGIDTSNIPTIETVKKTKREGLKKLHPDKGEVRSESDEEKRKKEEECKKFISSISIVQEYLVENGLIQKDCDVPDDEELDIEEILMKNNIPPAEFVDFKNKRKQKLNKRKVQDHCHFSGQFRGAAHSICNLRARVDDKNAVIPVFMHNFSGYDSHIVLKCFAGKNWEDNIDQDDEEKNDDYSTEDTQCNTRSNERNITVLAKSMEKFMSIRVGKHLVFKDSLNFLPSSLDSLVQNLRDGAEGDIQKLKEKFPLTYKFFKEKFPHLKEELFQHLTRKGVYPYSYFDCHERFDETSLPERSAYKSDLTKEDISDDDFTFSRVLWRDFGLETLGDLHDLYVATDVYLLADVFERFRKCEYKEYQLDPAHFYSLPSLSWTSCLKKTGVRLQILDDIDMCLFIDRALTGGVALIGQHSAYANNPYMKSYDSSKKISWIMNLDCTNQYGWAMSQPLPTGGFKWIDPGEWDAEKIMSVDIDSTIGHFFEVDLVYPNHLHEKHNQYPFGPEKVRVTEDILSDDQKKMAARLGLKIGGEKLMMTLNPKKNYVCHSRQLKQMLEHGLILTKVHRVLSFSQSRWLKPYIEHNTMLRKQSKNKFEKDLAKLRNNSVFGKTCEDVRRYIDVKIVLNPEKAQKFFNSYRYKRVKRYGDNLLAIEMRKKEVLLNKPRYVGASVLNISKTVMYDFGYYYLKRYPGSKLCFTDTDSLCFWTPFDGNIYEDLKDNEWIDFSNYPKPDPQLQSTELYDISQNYSEEKKLVPGFFKDDMGGKVINSFIGLRAKMYMIEIEGGQLKSACKGVPRHVKERLTIDDYRRCLDNVTSMTHSISRIGHKNHDLYTMETSKVTLLPFNDKKYVFNDGNELIARSHGHFENEDVDEDIVDLVAGLM